MSVKKQTFEMSFFVFHFPPKKPQILITKFYCDITKRFSMLVHEEILLLSAQMFNCETCLHCILYCSVKTSVTQKVK